MLAIIIFTGASSILIFPAIFMIILARFRFDVAKDLIPDLTYYNYKDPLTSHLHVGAVVMVSIATIIILGTLIINCITWMIETLSKENVIKFFRTAGIILLLLLGIIVAILAPSYYIINAIVNAIVSQPVPQLMTSQFNFIRLL